MGGPARSVMDETNQLVFSNTRVSYDSEHPIIHHSLAKSQTAIVEFK